MSIYLVAVERGIGRAHRLSIKLLHFLEALALKQPDLLILDTDEYVKWFSNNYNVDPGRFRLIPTGADDRVFTPLDTNKTEYDKFRILYAGSFIPNHGVKYIVEAARLLNNESEIVFELIGNGPDHGYAHQYVSQHHLQNIIFIDWIEKEKLIQYIHQADICLGAFGTTPQSMMTVQNKIYETLAMAKPLISGDSETIRHHFNHGEHIYLCDRANGQALAKAIIDLWKNPSLRDQIALNGYRLFIERYNLANNGKRFVKFLQELIH